MRVLGHTVWTLRLAHQGLGLQGRGTAALVPLGQGCVGVALTGAGVRV